MLFRMVRPAWIFLVVGLGMLTYQEHCIIYRRNLCTVENVS